MDTSETCSAEFLAGTVLELQGDSALVELDVAAPCGSCCQAKACFPTAETRHQVLVLNTQQVQPGQRVALSQDGRRQLQLSLLHYGLPLAAFVGGVALGAVWQPLEIFLKAPELWQFLLGLAALLAAGLLARRISLLLARAHFAVFSIIKS